MQLNKKILLPILIVVLVPLTGISIDMYTPSLPAIQADFSSPESLVKLTISVYLIGYAIGQVFAGVLADSFGRRPILLVTLFGYMLVSFSAALSPSIYLLLLFRFLQGVFVGGPGIMFKVLVTDNFTGKAFKNINTLVFSVWSISPIIAPYLGGYIQHYFNWETNFIIMGSYALLVIALHWTSLPETAPELYPIRAKIIAKNFQFVFTNKIFLLCVFQIMAMSSIIYLFNAAGPFLFQVNMGFNAVEYGQVALLLGAGVLAGVMGNRLLLSWFKPSSIVLIGLCLMVMICIYFAIMAKTISSVELIILLLLLFILQPIVALNNMMEILSTFTKTAGLATAMMGSLFIGGSGIIVALASLMKLPTPFPFSIVYLVLTAISLLIFLIFQRESLQ